VKAWHLSTAWWTDLDSTPGSQILPDPLPIVGNMKRVTGIGGIFFKAKDPVGLQAWYKAHLGIDVQDWGGTAFNWKDSDGKPIGGTTIWSMNFASAGAPRPNASLRLNRTLDLSIISLA
jgi:hypothetical protein